MVDSKYQLHTIMILSLSHRLLHHGIRILKHSFTFGEAFILVQGACFVLFDLATVTLKQVRVD